MELACHGQVDLFFSYDKDDKAAARALCVSCPFQLVCVSGALQRGDTDGIWGGVDLGDVRARRAAWQALDDLIPFPPRRRPLRATRTLPRPSANDLMHDPVWEGTA